MRALQATGEQGGWPLTMFLTPDAEPVWGGTYFPKQAIYGRPAFTDVLKSVAHTFAEAPDRVDHNRAALTDYLAAVPVNQPGQPGPALLRETTQLVEGLFDAEHGGIRGVPKFPQPALLELLSRASERGEGMNATALLDTTLRNMLQGGIYDHIGGGLSRYSVDDRWLVPHFEKMLYDNALLIERATPAWRQSGSDLLRIRIEETIAWLLREMRVGGGFASSLDADSGEGEGAFYVWTPQEVAAVLGPDEAAAFCRIYDITGPGNFEGASIPNRLAHPQLLDPDTESRLASNRNQLLQVREERPRPARDDKVLADWNGLAIAAFARAATTFARPEWLDAARSAYRFVTESMMIDGRLRHSFKDGRCLDVGFASDYGAMIGAAFALHEATHDDRYLGDAETFAETLDRHHWDESVGAWRLTADDAEDLFVRPLSLHDDSVPSPNAVIAAGLSRLSRLTGNARHAARLDALFTRHLGEPRDALGKAGLLNAFDQHLNGRDIVIVAAANDSLEAWFDIIRAEAREAGTVLVVTDPDALPDPHPAHGKMAIDGRTTAYLCSATACSAPVTEIADLVGMLRF